LTDDSERVERLLEALDARDDVRIVRAPGRVNLIGEHTDYNNGFVMPAAISLDTWIASRPRNDGQVRVTSLQQPGDFTFEAANPGRPAGAWRDYIAGVATVLNGRGVALRGVTAVVDSNIPVGAGLSSSAALELAAAWTLSANVPPPLRPLDLARAAQQAENEYVGVQCGLMDQFASASGVAGHALLLDCMTLDYHAIPLPPDLTLVAIDTRTPHKLSASEYNVRRAQCERGAALLATRHPGVRSLRDVTDGMLRDAGDLLDAETLRRCRHVVEENERVLAAGNALANGELWKVGQLFAASHASLRDLYEVSSPELDLLVEIATNVPGVIGARMTGAGFGGCTVNLVERGAVGALREAVESEYPRRAGRDAGYYIVDAVDGAGVVQ
jgi:galactokinase